MKIFKVLLFTFLCFFVINLKVSALEDGVYIIHSAINDNYVVDVNSAVAQNGSNIQLYQSNGTSAQKFNIKSLGNGYYEISSFINNNYVLDVSGAVYANKTNVQLYKKNNTNAQKWLIKDVGNNYYEIKSYNQSYTLDVLNGAAKNYSNVQLYKSNGTSAQKFRFERVFEKKQTISDGLYTISSKLDNNKVLDVKSAVISNYSNIQLYESNNTDAQKWFVNYLGNGFYSIKPYLSLSYSMDVNGASKSNGANVQLYSYNNTNAQKWIISDAGDGYYNIVSNCNGLVVDVSNASTSNGTNIWMYAYNDSNAQKFKFNSVKEIGSKTINDGYYFINTSLNSDKALDVKNASMSDGNNVQIYSSNGTLAQKWYVKYQDDGYYSILSDKDNNYALEVDPSGNNVRIGKSTNSDNQKWIIKKTGSYYYLISKDGRYLDLANASTSNGNNIRVFTPNGTNAQKYSFRKTVSGISEITIDNGLYRIVSALDNNKVVDLKNASTSNYSNVQLYQSNGSNAQKWEVTYLDNGYYKISTLLDLTKSFDVNSAGTKNGTNVQIYDNNNSIAQQWIIKDAGDGYFYIISNCNGLYLDVANASSSNGANIWTYESNGTKAQKFKFVRIEEKTRVLDVSYHQGEINWDKVVNTGIYGVILRIGYWDTEDERFSEYISEVKRLGIPYGIYLFSYASTVNGANTEANFTKNMISKYDLKPTLGIFYDIESWSTSTENSSSISKERYDEIINTYINSVSSYVGAKYKVKVYASTNYINNRFGDSAKKHVDWVADYRGYCGYNGSYSLWQYSSSETLDGIRGFVDMNYLY